MNLFSLRRPSQRYAVTLGLTSALVGGCHVNQPSVPLALSPVRAPFAVSLAVAPLPVRSLDLKTFTVHLTDTSSEPVAGARVSVTLAMPTMDMGRNEFSAQETGPGVYVGHGRLTMMGDWNAIVTATKGPTQAVRSFPLTAD